MTIDAGDAALIAVPASAAALAILTAGQGLGLTRFDLSVVLGSMVTNNVARWRVLGYCIFVAIGVLWALVYAIIFAAVDASGIGVGVAVGVTHALVVLALLQPLLPTLSDRIASERSGPWDRPALEPPGWFAVNYGERTPAVVVVAHATFGALLGMAVGS